MEHFGFAMGPFRMGDLAGNDIGWAIRKRRYVEQPELTYSRNRRPPVRDGPLRPEDRRRLVRLRARRPRGIPDPEVDALMIAALAATVGIERRAISDDEIVERWSTRWSTKARVHPGRGHRQQACDIDIVYLTGYGFPRFRGGPMRYADEVGPVQRGARDAALRRRRHRRAPGRRLEAGAAARAARRRRQDLHRLSHARDETERLEEPP